MIQEYPNMLLTLTWCHCTPADTPTSSCIPAISTEHQLDNVACAGYIGRQGGAHSLVSDQNVAIGGGAAALLHQSCPVAVHNCQVVVATNERVIVILVCRIIIIILSFNVESIKFQGQDQSLLNFYCLCQLKVVRIEVGIVWRGDDTCG